MTTLRPVMILAQERHLRALDHLFVDLSRLRNEEEYGNTPAGFSEVAVCTLDPGTPRSTLVAAKRLTAPASLEFGRLAVVSKVTSFGSSRLMTHDSLGPDSV